jgi:5-methylcytosine-specific restriction endonuclease McrA
MNRKTIDLSTRQGRNLFYQSKEWRALRSIVLVRDVYCQECLKNNIHTIATECDHIIDIKDRPDLFMSLDNICGLCKSCHSRKTFHTRRSFQKQVFTVDNLKWKDVSINK